jgi:hypothetical protein
MDDAELFKMYREYDPDRDLSGKWRDYLNKEILKRCGGLENFDGWLMRAKLSALEKEASEKEKRGEDSK